MSMVLNYVWLLGFLGALIILDRNIADYIILQFKRVGLAYRSLLMRAQLEKDIFFIKHSKTKYLKEARDLLKELGVEPNEHEI